MKGQISVQLSTLFMISVQFTENNITCITIFFFTFYSRFLLNMILSWTCLFHCPKNKSCCLSMFSSVTTTECLSRYMHIHNLLISEVYLYWCVISQTCNCTAPLAIIWENEGIQLFQQGMSWQKPTRQCQNLSWG